MSYWRRGHLTYTRRMTHFTSRQIGECEARPARGEVGDGQEGSLSRRRTTRRRRVGEATTS